MECGDGSDLNIVVLERDSDFMNSPGGDLGIYLCFIYASSDSSVCPLFYCVSVFLVCSLNSLSRLGYLFVFHICFIVFIL